MVYFIFCHLDRCIAVVRVISTSFIVLSTFPALVILWLCHAWRIIVLHIQKLELVYLFAGHDFSTKVFLAGSAACGINLCQLLDYTRKAAPLFCYMLDSLKMKVSTDGNISIRGQTPKLQTEIIIFIKHQPIQYNSAVIASFVDLTKTVKENT